jgi:hypothetical protein
MEQLIKSLEEYAEVMKAFNVMVAKMDSTLDTTISSLKLIMEQYDQSK